MAASIPSPSLLTHSGGCHCGAVRFEVDAPADLVVWDCNCSICSMKRNTHFVVPASQFRLDPSSEASLTTYTFNTHTARHRFCKVCGVQSFYHPRSNPDGVAVTVHCLDDPGAAGTTMVRSVTTRRFDGGNWEACFSGAGAAIKAFSKTTTTTTTVAVADSPQQQGGSSGE
jgi:hypothetical protein